MKRSCMRYRELTVDELTRFFICVLRPLADPSLANADHDTKKARAREATCKACKELRIPLDYGAKIIEETLKADDA